MIRPRILSALAIPFAALLLAGCAAMGGVHSADRLSRVERGMTQEETLRLLGAPDERMRFSGTGTESWDYRYFDPWGYLALYSVTFGPDGRVVGLLSSRLNDGGDHQ